MNSVCIITDATALFSKPTYAGCQLVNIVPFSIKLKNKNYPRGENLKIFDFPVTARNGLNPALIPPSPAEFKQIFTTASHHYREIVVLLLSGQLSPATNNARQAALQVHGQQTIEIIDSQTIGPGLGFLVQAAAAAAQDGARSVDIERLVRGLIPNIYTLLSIPGLTYLFHAGKISLAQALVGEMLNMIPLFTLEEGHLTPLEKARNSRHLMDSLQEFIDEFNEPRHIALLECYPQMIHEFKALREHAVANFNTSPFTEHQMTPQLAALFGPRTTGVFLLDKPEL
jgi:DegV family protein with EDD domain